MLDGSIWSITPWVFKRETIKYAIWHGLSIFKQLKWTTSSVPSVTSWNKKNGMVVVINNFERVL